MYCLLRCTRVDIQLVEISYHVEMGTLSAYHLYGNFRKKNSIKWYCVFFLTPKTRVVQYSQIDSIGVSGGKKGLHWYQWYDWYQ